MFKRVDKKKKTRMRRVMRIRKPLRGVEGRMRLSVFKSNRYLFAQIIDDAKGETLASCSSLTKEAKELKLNNKSKKTAAFIGEKIAQIAKEKNIEKVVFDRGRYKFHGIIAELANAARKAGLQF